MVMLLFGMYLLVCARAVGQRLGAGDSKLHLNDIESNNNARSEPKKFQYYKMDDLVDASHDRSEYWQSNDLLKIVRLHLNKTQRALCPRNRYRSPLLTLPARRTVRPVCRSKVDQQLCPQCPRLSNLTECELFRDSCRERRVAEAEYTTYCDQKYGKWRTLMVPADYTKCHCCDECVLFRELDQSCVHDDYVFESEEFLPVTTIDFRGGCNPYWGHPGQEQLALRCDPVLRRCVPISMAPVPHSFSLRRRFHIEAPPEHCAPSCRGVHCPRPLLRAADCRPGAFLPAKDHCNCCGKCSPFQQLNEKCAEYRRSIVIVDGAKETEVEEEFIEPGCDDGLVCRQGLCQDIHRVAPLATRRDLGDVSEPCRREMKYFKKMYGTEGHLHYNAPQCTPLWVYGPVQCRQFTCYCALESGARIEGIKVPRLQVSSMNCDCAREKCRTGGDAECDGYGNYKQPTLKRKPPKRNADGEPGTGSTESDPAAVPAATKLLPNKIIH